MLVMIPREEAAPYEGTKRSDHLPVLWATAGRATSD